MNIKTKKAISVVSFILIVFAVVLMVLPFSTTLTFAPGPNEKMIVPTSYFDFTSYAYGNFFPPLTSICSTLWLFFTFWKLIKDKEFNNQKPLLLFGVISSLFSFFSLFSTINPNVFGIIICGILVISVVLQFVMYLA